MIAVLKGVIRNGRVEVAGPIDLSEGTSVVVAPEAGGDDGPVPSDEIAHVLAAMHRLQPLEIPDSVAGDLDAWERTLDQQGIDHADSRIEDVSR